MKDILRKEFSFTLREKDSDPIKTSGSVERRVGAQWRWASHR
jgi:hypothetical protein